VSESAFQNRVLPLSGLLITAATLFHLIRVFISAGGIETLLWFWVPQPHLLGLSVVGVSVVLASLGTILVSSVSLCEVSQTTSRAQRLYVGAVVILSCLFAVYAVTVYMFRAPLIAAAERQVRDYGDQNDRLGYAPDEFDRVFRELGIPKPEKQPRDDPR
jgi:hypothetical protein